MAWLWQALVGFAVLLTKFSMFISCKRQSYLVLEGVATFSRRRKIFGTERRQF
jgi:hypothetical protein